MTEGGGGGFLPRGPPIGKVYDLEKKRVTRSLDCPVYHLSPDGLYGIAPNLTKLHVTQWGYGILPFNYMAADGPDTDTNKEIFFNRGSPVDDGLFKIDIETGKCDLFVSLREISKAVGLPLDVPTYGFHTKWSDDGEIIMFIVRTLQTATQSIEGMIGKLSP